jgi:hypothetical protein
VGNPFPEQYIIFSVMYVGKKGRKMMKTENTNVKGLYLIAKSLSEN